MFSTLAHVAIGGAIGAMARYLTGISLTRLIGHGFPFGTLTVNIVGSFLMGVLVVVLAETSQTRLAPLLMTGLLGGFTTFSAFSLDAITLFERGQVGIAAAYVAGSGILSLAALVLGLWITRGAFS
jgi:CrcB protein